MAEPPVRPTSRARLLGGGLALLLPLFGLGLLLARRDLDLQWEHHPAHFWLVLVSAMVSAVLAYATGEAAARRGDARVLHVSLAFLSAAGFLGLHALATPGVLVGQSNTGFAVATPVGVALGSAFAARSTADLSGDRAVREVRIVKRLRLALLGLMLAWAVLSLTELPPLNRPPADAEGLPLLLAVPAVLLYAGSAARYLQLWLRRPSLMLLAMLSAFVLLAEAWWRSPSPATGTCPGGSGTSSCWQSSAWWRWVREAPGTRNGSPTSTFPTPAPVAAR